LPCFNSNDLMSLCFTSFVKGALETAVNHGGSAKDEKELYSLLCQHKPANTTLVFVQPKPMQMTGKSLSGILKGIRQCSFARFPEPPAGASFAEALDFFTCSLSPAGCAEMETRVKLQSVHAKRGTVAGVEWLAAHLEVFKEGTRTTLALGSADEALVTEDGCGCVHPCTTVVPPLREVDKSQRAQRKEAAIAKKLGARTLHQVALAEGIEFFVTNGSTQKAYEPVALDVPEVAVKFEVTMASNATSEPQPWSYSADDKFGFKSGHALRKNKPIMRLPGPLLTFCRTTFDRGNTAGHSKRSAAAVWHDLLAGELKAKWHLRTGFSEARLKAMFSSMSQKKKGAEKVVAVPVAVAGGGGGGHDLEG